MSTLLLPMELIAAEILTRLPAKSLLRFKCVCKSFKTLISSPEFIDAHLRRSHSSDTNDHFLFINQPNGRLYSVDLHNPNSTAIHLPLPDRVSVVLGSCNGLFCFFVVDPFVPCHFKLFNPSTGIYKEIEFDISELPSRDVCLSFGFGFDCENNDYKLVMFVDYYCTAEFVLGDEVIKRNVFICGSKNGFRTSADIWLPEDSVVLHNKVATTNNSLLNCVFWSSSKNKHWCGCFDVRGEQWVEDVPLPDYNGGAMEKLHDVVDIGAIDGCLCLLTKNHQHSSVDVWIMKEYRVKESWIKLLDISDSVVTRSLKVVPFAYGKQSKDDILLLKEVPFDYGSQFIELVWYNRVCKKAVKAEIYGDLKIFEAFMCKDSLVTIPGGKQLKWVRGCNTSARPSIVG